MSPTIGAREIGTNKLVMWKHMLPEQEELALNT